MIYVYDLLAIFVIKNSLYPLLGKCPNEQLSYLPVHTNRAHTHTHAHTHSHTRTHIIRVRPASERACRKTHTFAEREREREKGANKYVHVDSRPLTLGSSDSL